MKLVNVNHNICRNKLNKELRKISVFYKNPNHFTSENILFPHIWQRKLTKKNKNDKWDRDRIYYRSQILKAVTKFVYETKRFNDDFGI